MRGRAADLLGSRRVFPEADRNSSGNQLMNRGPDRRAVATGTAHWVSFSLSPDARSLNCSLFVQISCVVRCDSSDILHCEQRYGHLMLSPEVLVGTASNGESSVGLVSFV